MKKLETLKKNYEFKNVMSKGNYYCGKFITIYIKKNKLEKNVIGIAVSTKTAKAVVRNRIKRLIRENYQLKKDKLNKGYDIVFLWNQRNSVDDIDFYKIQNDIDIILKKANMFL